MCETRAAIQIPCAPAEDPIERNCAAPLPSPSGTSATLPQPAPTTWTSGAPDADNAAMGQCYPKCMPEVGDGDGAGSALARAARTSKPRHSLAAMKLAVAGEDDSGDLDATPAMATMDLEELAGAAALVASPPKSIVVDYEEAREDAGGLTMQRPRQNSITDCARDACRPLGSEYAQQPAGELLLTAAISSSTPVTPGRRRTRKDSVGAGSTAASAPAVTPRRGKTLVLENPASPSTTTDSSEGADERCSSVPKLCMCEVQLHKSRASCWLVASGQVYDVTGILDAHPGGSRSLLRKAGGPDCTQDMKFHTKNARKMLEKCFIGKLQPCGDEPERSDSNCSIM
ncbi:hypothetical protein PybrP1_005233 [[Pythium] brassicae (nom. inval.)]|nr:hypothetical protein PybrP1_005233 [[Pythium] brassicae (nom. inval.)]